MVFRDGSSKRVRGWEQAWFGGFYGEGDERNFSCPLDPHEVQTNGRQRSALSCLLCASTICKTAWTWMDAMAAMAVGGVIQRLSFRPL